MHHPYKNNEQAKTVKISEMKIAEYCQPGVDLRRSVGVVSKRRTAFVCSIGCVNGMATREVRKKEDAGGLKVRTWAVGALFFRWVQ